MLAALMALCNSDSFMPVILLEGPVCEQANLCCRDHTITPMQQPGMTMTAVRASPLTMLVALPSKVLPATASCYCCQCMKTLAPSVLVLSAAPERKHLHWATHHAVASVASFDSSPASNSSNCAHAGSRSCMIPALSAATDCS